MEKIKLEIRAAEGGDDAKILCIEMANIYKKAATINNFTYSIEQ
jgi:protein subunit release factor A